MMQLKNIEEINVTREGGLFVPVEVRLPEKQAAIVEILLDLQQDEEITGYEIVKRSNGAIPLGGIYTHLDRLEGKGIIVSRIVVIQKHKGAQTPKRMVRLKNKLAIRRKTDGPSIKTNPQTEETHAGMQPAL